MKPNHFSKFLVQTMFPRSFRHALAAPALVLSFAAAQAGTTAPATAPVEETSASNWISFTVGGAFVSGDEAGMMRRTQTNGDFYGGIDTFQFSKALNDSTTLTLDGHALPGLEDYEFNLNLNKTDVGYIKAGYKEYRTWYDGSGGYNPNAAPINRWVVPFNDELSLDRGEIYFEAGLRLPNVPNITFGYQHLWRDGTKDSTMWGRTAAPTNANVPAFYDLDETRDIFKLDIEHTIGNTDIDLGLRYDTSNNNDTRYEYRLYNNIPATDKKITQRDNYDSDLFNAHLFTETRLGERVIFNLGYSFTSMDTDVDGSSRVFSNYTSGFDESYRNLIGGSDVKTHVANASIWWNPIDDLVIAPSFRVQWEDISSSTRYNLFALGVDEDVANANDENRTTTSEQLEIRYTGISNVLLYARGQWSQQDGDRYLWEDIDGGLSERWTDISLEKQKYVVGANWYPMHGLSLSAQYYYQSYDEDFNQIDGGISPMMRNHSFDTNDANIRLTWRALPNLTFVSRYDYQQTDINNTGFDPTLVEVQSGDVTSNIFSQSVTWNATERFYLQGSVHWIMSETDTGYNFGRVTNMDNDYFAGSLSAGYAIDAKTELTGCITYYGASNYAPMTTSMGYGLNTEEFGASLTLTRMITPNMIWNLRYAFLTSNTDPMPDQSGGFNDFDAHMISTGLQIRF